MSVVVLDDHLLRDVLAGEPRRALARLVETDDLATTNLYYVRLCRSVVGAGGGRLTGGWSPARRRALGHRLLAIPDSIAILPLSLIGYRVAELAHEHNLSTLGAEAVAAADQLGAVLCVWNGDDGPGIRAAARATGVAYRTVAI